MRFRAATMVTLVLAASTSLYASDDPFIGTWKLNTSKSEVKGVREEIKDLGGNKYEFKFGDDAQTIVADGADHPNKWGGTWAIKEDGPEKWTQTIKHGGNVTRTENWTLSDGGNVLTISSKGTRPDGSQYTDTLTAKRVGSGSGMCGTWEIAQWEAPSISDWVIQSNGADGLSFTTPADKEHLDMKFDGKDYTDVGPRVAPGSASSASRPDPHTIEMTDKLKGKVVDKTEMKVSEDGKTLTLAVTVPGESKTMTYVYDRQ